MAARRNMTRLRLPARFILGAERTDPLMVEIVFSETDGGPIRGYVYGTSPTAEQCGKMMTRESVVLLESTMEMPRLVARNVILLSSEPFPGFRRSTNADSVRRVASFICGSVEYTTHRNSAPERREIGFRLVGDAEFLFNRELPTYRASGERLVENIDSPVLFERDPMFPGSIELGGTYHWMLSRKDKSGSFVRLAELRFTASDGEPSDDELLERAKAVAADLTSLMSFVARRSVAWYRLGFVKSDGHYLFRAPSSRRRDGKSKWRTLLPFKEREFLVQALPRLRQLRSDGLDLSLAMVYLVPAHTFRYVEERFALAFLGLEKLVHLLVVHRGRRDRIFGESHARAIRDRARAVLEEQPVGPSEWKDPLHLVREKLAELNRPAFRDQLAWVLEEYDIEWRDLYPPGFDAPHPKFISTRNTLFHSSKPVEDGGPILRESRRVLAVSERIILRLLGWADDAETNGDSSYGLRLNHEI